MEQHGVGMQALIAQLTLMLEQEIQRLPLRFHNSFAYTTPGRNFTHPVTLGLLSKILWNLQGIQYVGVDFRLNERRTKFQPDLVGLLEIEPFTPLLFVDYESPNSSDTRIPVKDVQAYQAWSRIYGKRVPYVIITTLPKGIARDWELRYTARSKYNEQYRATRDETRTQIQRSPYDFWYSEYRKALHSTDLSQVFFINIDGRHVEHVTL